MVTGGGGQQRRLAILGRLLGNGGGFTTERLCHVCADATGATGAGIMLMSGDVPRGSVCTTDSVSALIEQLQDDRDSLDRLARRLGVETPQWKAVLGTFGAKLGVVKLSGRVLSYSPLSRVLEAEALIMAIEGKQQLWDVLRTVAATSTPRATSG